MDGRLVRCEQFACNVGTLLESVLDCTNLFTFDLIPLEAVIGQNVAFISNELFVFNVSITKQNDKRSFHPRLVGPPFRLEDTQIVTYDCAMRLPTSSPPKSANQPFLGIKVCSVQNLDARSEPFVKQNFTQQFRLSMIMHGDCSMSVY